MVAASSREALEFLLKNEVAVILVDVCMPELDGFELAAMIREHPRFQKTAMIFIRRSRSATSIGFAATRWARSTTSRCRWCRRCCGRDRVFAGLYRKTRQLEQLNAELENRVRART